MTRVMICWLDVAAPVSDEPPWMTEAWGTIRQTFPLRTAANWDVRRTCRNSSQTPLRLSGSAETTLTWPATAGSSTSVRPVMRETCSATSLMSAPRILMITSSATAAGADWTAWATTAPGWITGPTSIERASTLVVERRMSLVTLGS